MDLLIRHQTTYRYADGAGRVAMRLKLVPGDTPAQTVRDWRVSVNDVPVTQFTTSGYGEPEAIWMAHDRLDEAVIVAEGFIETRETYGVLGQLRSRLHPHVFLRETPLTASSDAIRAMAWATSPDGGPIARLHALSAAISEAVPYLSGVTTADTSAAQAFALGAGVCQDHAQIFIAACRALGIPARYVSGYLLAEGDDALHETHGWAEALVPDLGWVGFDPSNRVSVTERYVRLTCGLDANDAAPIRGSVMLAGDIRIDADVRIAQAGPQVEARQSQRQQQQLQQQQSGPPPSSIG
ncbi:MAG: transglutaminase family protein [Sphingobium sp.]